MFRDARELEDGSAIEADLCIVGGGVAGITIARELAGDRTRVCLLESGGLEYEPAIQDLYAGEIIGLPYFALDVCRLRLLGGTSNHWAGRCRPLDEIDFEAREWVPRSGWPFGRAELDPYYRRAQTLCQLGPFEYEAEAWLRDGESALPFDFATLRSLVWQYSPPTAFGEVYGPELERAANVEVLLHASALEILTNEAGSAVEGIRFGTLDGRRFTARARTYVLACGGLETPRLLLVSRGAAASGLGNAHDLVGRCFMEHPHLVAARALIADPSLVDLYTFGRHEEPRRGQRVLGCLNLGPERQRRERLLNVDFNFTEDSIGDSGYAALRRLWNAVERGEVPDPLLADLKQALLDIDDTFAGLLGRFGLRDYAPAGAFRVWSFVEQAPDPDSRVRLGDEVDALGLPRLQLDWRLSALDRASLLGGLQALAAELGRTGIGRLQIEDWLISEDEGWSPELAGGYHHMGTTRMADDPRQGVVDAACRVHGVANLYIAGSSVFPTSGSANPTLTIVALALRLADHLQETLQA